MALIRGNEFATIDVVMVTVQVQGETDELALNTASNIAVEAQIETQEPIKLIIKNILKAQKPQQNVLTGTTITLTDNVFNPQLVLSLQGGEITYDSVETDRIVKYTPPVAGSMDRGDVFTMKAYSAVYNAAGLVSAYEVLTFPNCQGAPVAMSSEDNVFRVPEYTINSAGDLGEAPYTIEWIKPEQLPALPPAI